MKTLRTFLLCALAVFLVPMAANAAGISVSPSSGTSPFANYIPGNPLTTGSVGDGIIVARPDGTIIDEINDETKGFECNVNTGIGTNQLDSVDISQNFYPPTCALQAPNPYGTYTFLESEINILNVNCDFGSALLDCENKIGDGNYTTATYLWQVPDTSPPVIGSTSDISIDTTDSSGAVVSYTDPTATDDRDGAVSVSCAPTSGGLFAVGTSVVTCTATDAAHNTATSSFNVVISLVTPPPADAPPAPTSPVPAASGGGGSIIAATQGPLVSDSFGGPPTGLLPSTVRITPAPPGYRSPSGQVLAASIGPVAMAPALGQNAGQLAAAATAPGIGGLINWLWLLPFLLLGALTGWGYARIYGK